MSIADLIKKTASAADTIQRLTAERDAARAALSLASKAWGDALCDEDAGNGDAATTARLERELDKAQKVFTSKDAALNAASLRQVEATAKAKVKQAEGEWAEAIRLAAARAEAAAKCGHAMEAFTASYLALAKLSADLAGAIPGDSPDFDAAFCRRNQVESAARLELQRLGLPWENLTPWGAVSIPDFLPQFEGTPQLLRRWKAR